MQATLICDLEADASMPDVFVEKQPGGKRICKAGTTINHLMCFRLVQMGVAVPADEECRLAANRTPEQLVAAQKAAVRLSKGIDPSDFEAYEKGIMDGYNADGSFIPGPNYHLLEQDEDTELDEDDDE